MAPLPAELAVGPRVVVVLRVGMFCPYSLTVPGGVQAQVLGLSAEMRALGAWFGWQALPLIIILSSFVGAFVGISMIMLRRQERDTPMPFGPYLAGAGLLTLFYGDSLTATYYNMLGL